MQLLILNFVVVQRDQQLQSLCKQEEKKVGGVGKLFPRDCHSYGSNGFGIHFRQEALHRATILFIRSWDWH